MHGRWGEKEPRRPLGLVRHQRTLAVPVLPIRGVVKIHSVADFFPAHGVSIHHLIAPRYFAVVAEVAIAP